jgi:hypothetical protein
MPPNILDVLADHGLLESLEPCRYTLHQTIADYARLGTADPEAARRFARYGAQFSTKHAGENEVLDLDRHNLLTALEIAFQRCMSAELIQGTLALHSFLLERGLYSLAELHLSRALSLMSTSQDAERYTLLLAREKACDVLGKREAQCQDLEALAELAETLDDSTSSPGSLRRAQVALRWANYAWTMSDYVAMRKRP